MKKFTLQKLANLMAILVLSSVALVAQESKELTVVKKITRQDGTTVVEAETAKGETLKEQLESLGKVEGKEVEIHLMTSDGEPMQLKTEGGETLIFVRPAKTEREKDDVEEVRVIWHGDEKDIPKVNLFNLGSQNNYRYNSNYGEPHDPCAVFIGVGTSHTAEGLEVDYTIEDTPARISGVQKGDIILALDNVAVKTQGQLIQERDKHEPGDAFSLSILRNGTPMAIQAEFKKCSTEELKQLEERREQRLQEIQERAAKMAAVHREAERAILGIYPDDNAEEGLRIGSLVAGKGAEAAGLQSGDIVTKVNGMAVRETSDLRTALASQKVGNTVAVEYLRDGQVHRTDVQLSSSTNSYSYTTERDPCLPFIGVYTTSNNGLITVSGVIENTPAKNSGILPGDMILSLDNMPVATQRELEAERDKHAAGDNFTLQIMRNGELKTIHATFKACPKENAVEEPVEEVVELAIQEEPAIVEETQEALPALELNNQLKVEAFNLYPNPTISRFNVTFQAEALPTVVRLMDAAGRVIYTEEINKFDGYYNKELSLSGQTPGTYFLTVQQNDKVLSKKVVLMPRA